MCSAKTLCSLVISKSTKSGECVHHLRWLQLCWSLNIKATPVAFGLRSLLYAQLNIRETRQSCKDSENTSFNGSFSCHATLASPRILQLLKKLHILPWSRECKVKRQHQITIDIQLHSPTPTCKGHTTLTRVQLNHLTANAYLQEELWQMPPMVGNANYRHIYTRTYLLGSNLAVMGSTFYKHKSSLYYTYASTRLR